MSSSTRSTTKTPWPAPTSTKHPSGSGLSTAGGEVFHLAARMLSLYIFLIVTSTLSPNVFPIRFRMA